MDDAGVPRSSRARAAAAGAVAAALALGLAELLAGAVPSAASPVLAVGDAVVDRVPAGLKTAAIAVFGQRDKAALLIGMVLVVVALGAGAGLLARRRFVAAVTAFAAFGLLGALAASGDARSSMMATTGVLVAAVAAGTGLLHRLLRPGHDVAVGGTTRRRFLQLAGAGLVVAVGGGWVGQWLRSRTDAAASRAALRVPAPVATARPLPPGTDLAIAGVEPFVTPTETFYRIDTALSVPRVDVATWRLAVTGMVDRPVDWTFDQLVAQGLEEHWTTLCCVSNEVGGRLIGNARWGGVALRDVLDLAGVQLGATQIVGRSVDGWTAGFPTEVAYDGRDALIAVTMNGEPLPLEHGFPARLVVPGLYGYVSATKWLSEIELTTWDAFDAYWVPRGWSKQGPIKTHSRIDTPRPGGLGPGIVAVAGVAWAQGRGIERVEVQVDDGPWEPARLATVPHSDTWRQWVWEWDAQPGSHVLQVRATDGGGRTQTPRRQGVMPDGATGYHRVLVQVRSA